VVVQAVLPAEQKNGTLMPSARPQVPIGDTDIADPLAFVTDKFAEPTLRAD
jgi:hypothetical protein